MLQEEPEVEYSEVLIRKIKGIHMGNLHLDMRHLQFKWNFINVHQLFFCRLLRLDIYTYESRHFANKL